MNTKFVQQMSKFRIPGLRIKTKKTVVNGDEGVSIQFINKGNVAASLFVNFAKNKHQRHVMNLANGETHPKHRRKGYGTILRAMATRAAFKAGVHVVTHLGVNFGKLAANQGMMVPISTAIVRNKLGFAQDPNNQNTNASCPSVLLFSNDGTKIRLITSPFRILTPLRSRCRAAPR